MSAAEVETFYVTETDRIEQWRHEALERAGYEPEAARAVFDRIGAQIEWVMLPWEDMIPAVRRGDAPAHDSS